MRLFKAVSASLSLLICASTSWASFNFATETKIDGAVSQMSLEEKVSMLGGVDDFNSRGIPRLGIKQIFMTDGPVGVRNGKQTAFPSGISMGATFDPMLIHDVSAAIADEARMIGKNMVLGPCVNISRHPFGGRNFESFGEDPFLSSQLAVSYIHGVQGRNVLASVKHYALNEQEYERFTINVHADMRTMFEMHFPAFKAAVDAGSWTVMASYNKVNGHWATENDFLLNQVLKGMWNFQGFVVSDWDATHSTVKAANAGLDLEMPSGKYFNQDLVQAVKEGQVPEYLIDDKVRRILRAMYGVGIMGDDVPPVGAPQGPDSAEHRALALRAAQDSIVLLKNADNILPLKNVKSIAVLGPNAATARTGGGGSSQVDPIYSVSPLQGLQSRLGRNVQVNYALGAALPGEIQPIPSAYLKPQPRSNENGLKATYFVGKEMTGKPFLTRIDPVVNFDFNGANDSRLKNNFSVRWIGFLTAPSTGTFKISTLSDDGVRLFINNQLVINNWTDHGWTKDTATVSLVAGKTYQVRLEYYQGGGNAQITLGWEIPLQNELAKAVEAAKASDVAIVFAGLAHYLESEAGDRTTFELPEGEVELIQAVAAANPNTVVVINSGNPVPMGQWVNQVKAIAQLWYPGQEGGHAIADVLMGTVNPSGKLPVTFLKRWEDSPAYGNYPGADGQVYYEEGIFIGYRHFDAKNVQPEFPFGFGLSYTQFSFHDFKVETVDSKSTSPQVRVTFQVSNVGAVAGAEVAQVYVGERAPVVARPVRELKGFQKVYLQPGETKTVSVNLDSSAFAYFVEETMKWRVQPGVFAISAGSSSRDLPLSGTITLK